MSIANEQPTTKDPEDCENCRCNDCTGNGARKCNNMDIIGLCLCPGCSETECFNYDQ